MDQRNAIEDLRQDATKVRVPSVHMHQVGIDLLAQGLKIGLESVQRAAELLVDVGKTAFSEREALHPHAFLHGILVTEATDFDVHHFGEFCGQILDVNTGSAINVRRIFTG